MTARVITILIHLPVRFPDPVRKEAGANGDTILNKIFRTFS